jgi:PAS domain S-box-containing protein
MFRTIITVAIVLGTLLLALLAYWGSGPFLGLLPMFIPMVSVLIATAAFSVSFLSLGRYGVRKEPFSLWAGLGFGAMGIFMVFYMLSWAELGPDGHGMISLLSNTPAWILQFSRMTVGICLLAAALAPWPHPDSRWARRWGWIAAGWFGLVTLLSVLFVRFEALLPQFVIADRYTTNLRIMSGLLFLLHGSGAILSTRCYRQTGDRLFGYFALFQITVMYAVLAPLVGQQRYEFWWYFSRVLVAVGVLVVLFGMLAGYVRLYRSERDRTEELERQGAILRAVLEQMPSGLIFAQWPSGQIVLSNNRAGEILGHAMIPSEDHQAYDQYSAIHPDGTPYGAEDYPLARALLHGEVIIQEEGMYRRGDGKVVWLATNAAPVVDEHGRRLASVAVFHDVTPQKRVEQTLRELNETLERRVAERTAVAERRARQLQALAVELSGAEERERRRLARILHDHLQQLVAAARFQIGSIQRSAPDRQQSGLGRASDLLDEAIQVSRNLTAEMSPPVLYELGLPAALDWLSQWMEENYGLVVRRQIDASVNIPSMGLRGFLYHATRELLFNVVKHAGVNEVMLDLEQQHQAVRVTVRDQGVGFDPLQQAADHGSFGLLNIRERLEYMGGRLEAVSAPGEGTRMTLWAPVQVLAESADVASGGDYTADGQESVEETSAKYSDRPPAIRVVVADDHHIIRQGLVVMLHDEEGFVVVGQAADGRAALDLARQLRPDIVLMDVTMPDMDGIEATERIRDEAPKVQVVGLSMHVDAQMAARMRQAGAVAYVTKGGDLGELVNTLRRVVTSRQN